MFSSVCSCDGSAAVLSAWAYKGSNSAAAIASGKGLLWKYILLYLSYVDYVDVEEILRNGVLKTINYIQQV